MTFARPAAADVLYPAEGGAVAALVVATDVGFGTAAQEIVVRLAQVAPYRPGTFFERELPALRALLVASGPVDLLVVDGFVDLDPDGRPGLGAHAHREFAVPVIGVAKTAFRTATHAVPVLRGTATKPLYVTAAGIASHDAAALVQGMAGPFRMPTLLRRVDTLSRSPAGTG